MNSQAMKSETESLKGLKKQNQKNTLKQSKCEHCLKLYSNKYNLKRHLLRCKSKPCNISNKIIKSLEDDKQILKNKIKDLEWWNNFHKQQKWEISDDNVKLKEENEKLKTERYKLKNVIEHLEDDNVELEEENEKLKKERYELKTVIEHFEDDHVELKEENEKLKKEPKFLNNVIKHIQDEFKDTLKYLRRVEDEQKEYKDYSNELEIKIENLYFDLNEKTEEVDHLNEIIQYQIYNTKFTLSEFFKNTIKSNMNFNNIKCPICFNELTTENIEIVRCGHFHCKQCKEKIQNCSICREII